MVKIKLPTDFTDETDFHWFIFLLTIKRLRKLRLMLNSFLVIKR